MMGSHFLVAQKIEFPQIVFLFSLCFFIVVFVKVSLLLLELFFYPYITICQNMLGI